MKSKHLLLTLLLALFVPWAAMAQTPSVTIGSGTAKSPYVPSYNYYKYSISQQIYTAEEINASGNITSISFYKDGTESSYSSRKFDIYMAHTTKTGFDASTDWIDLTDADIVFHGTEVYSFTNNAWNSITLETPFNYNGTDNLVICVIDRSGNYASSSTYASQYRVFSTGTAYQAIYKYTDDYPNITPDGYQSSSSSTQFSGTRLTTKNQIVLGGIQQTCAKPTNLAASLDATDHTIATLNWTENGEATSWVLQVATNNTFTEGLNSYNVSATPSKDLTGLTPETKYYARVRPSCSETLWSDVCEFKPTATVTVPIGDGTSSDYYLPVNTFYNYSLTQQIYTAAEIQAGGGSAGTINSISFYHDYANTTPQTMNGIKAYLLNTDKDAFTSSTDMVAVTDADKVWEGNITLNGKGWVTIDFTTPFEYDGDNLIICMFYPTKEYPGSSYKFRYTATTYYSSVYYYDDDDTDIPDLNNINTYGGSKAYQQYHNNIQIGIVPTNTPKPKNLHVVDNTLSSSGATLAWDAPTTATPTGYQYQYKEGEGEWTALQSTTELSAALSLSASKTYTFQVRAAYDGVGESDFVETTFTTLDDCAFPTNLVATTTPGQGTKATLTWVKGYDETAWVLEYATNNTFTEGLVTMTDGFTVEGNNVTANLTGLTAETHYYARVKADCDGSTSSPSNVADFTPTNYKDFTFGQTASYTSNYVPFYGNYASSSPLLSQFIIPSTELEDMAGGTIRRMTFYSSTASASWGDAEFSVYVKEVEASSFASSDAAGLEDWSSMTNVYNGSLSISGNQMVIEFENNFAYNGGNLMIGFNETTTGTAASANWYYVSGPSYSTLYAYNGYYGASYSRGSSLPKVTFNYQPTATPRPIITEPVPTTDVTATVAWTKPSDNVTGYKYQYKLASATEWPTAWIELDANAVSVTVPNLTPNTSYDFQIKAVYAEGESVASSTSFATTCPEATAVPYTYDFETAPKFNCWTVISGNITRMSGSAHASSSYRLDFRGTNSNLIALPAFAEATNTLRIEFWTRPESSYAPDEYSNYSGKFAVGYMTDVEDASTFVAIETYNATDWAESLTYTKKVVDFDVTGVPANAIIAMRQFDCATNYYWYVDDVKVKVIPTCEDVNDVHYVSFTNHSATIAWTADAAQAVWQIAYKAGANFDPYNAEELATATIVDVTSNPYLFDKNLAAETTYYMYVRGNCGDVDGLGDWSDSYATFTTLAASPAPNNFTASNIGSQTVDLVWTTGGGDYETSWDLYYLKSDDAPEVPTATTDATKTVTTLPTTENPYTLDGLTEESRYYIWVRANHTINSVTTHSAWVALTGNYFTTIAACSAMDPVVSNVTHHNATVTWTGESNDGYSVKYRVAAGIDGTTETFDGTSAPTGWEVKTGLLSDIMEGTALSASSFPNWTFGTSNGVFNNHTRLNIYGSSCKSWLISPEIEITDGYTMSFDLALTDYNSSTPAVHNGECTDDRFVVLVFVDDAWEILREWNNSGSSYVYNSISYAATGESVNISLSTYKNKTVKVAFYGESTTSGNGDNNLHIDNVTFGATVPAGEWQNQAATTTTADLTGLTAGTKYDLKVVPNCDATQESATVQFTTLDGNTKYFLTEGDWATAANWMDKEIPAITDNAIIKANATIASGTVAAAKKITFGSPTPTLTINDGGQLQTDNTVAATVKKNITGYGAGHEEDRARYYLIGNPLSSTISPSYTPYISATGMLTGNYDLYQWSRTSNLEWRNYEVSTFSLSNGTGYLYANESGVELSFTGTVKANNGAQSANVYYTAPSGSNEFSDWNLLGNPFVCNAYLVSAATDGTALPYYKMNEAGSDFEAVTGGAIAPMEGIFYQATEAGTVYFTRTAPSAKSAKLNMNLSKGNKQLDNAILVFGGDQQLGKMTFRANSSKVYMPQDGKDYAIVSTESNIGEMPVNFKAENNGTYTLSFTNEEVSFAYLHLIDNMTGIETDLLANPSYTFEARTTDYASRFKLVFATGSSTGSDTFAYYSNGNWVINNEGRATLQVVDVNGRILKSESINGCANVNFKAAAGIYMIRLVNGDNVKVQKVVVR